MATEVRMPQRRKSELGAILPHVFTALGSAAKIAAGSGGLATGEATGTGSGSMAEQFESTDKMPSLSPGQDTSQQAAEFTRSFSAGAGPAGGPTAIDRRKQSLEEDPIFQLQRSKEALAQMSPELQQEYSPVINRALMMAERRNKGGIA
jgi:hypothetical protein